MPFVERDGGILGAIQHEQRALIFLRAAGGALDRVLRDKHDGPEKRCIALRIGFDGGWKKGGKRIARFVTAAERGLNPSRQNPVSYQLIDMNRRFYPTGSFLSDAKSLFQRRKLQIRVRVKTSKRRSERVSGSPEITIEGWKQHAVGETYLGH